MSPVLFDMICDCHKLSLLTLLLRSAQGTKVYGYTSDLYLTTRNIYKRQDMPIEGFEPAIPGNRAA